MLIARGEIEVDVNDAAAIAALRKLDREFERTMDDIDRRKATAEVDANLGPLRDSLANAKRLLRVLEAEEANPEINVDEASAARFKKDIAEARALVKSMDGALAEAELKFKYDEHEMKAAQAQLDAIAKKEKALKKIQEDAHEVRMKALDREARRRRGLREQEAREYRQAENEAHAIQNRMLREERAEERAHRLSMQRAEREAHQRNRELDEVPKLEAAYARLTEKLHDLAEAKYRSRRDERAVALIEVDERHVLSQVEALRKEIRDRVGRDPVEIPARIEIGRRAGERVRTALLLHGGSWAGAFTDIGVDAGRHFSTGMRRGFRRSIFKDLSVGLGRNVLGAAGHGLSRFASTLANLSEMTVRIGPFTATIKQLGLALSILGPTILDLVGAFGALIGVMGSATVGLAALSVGFIGGLIPAAAGVFMVLKPLTEQFGKAMKASDAYQQAVSKHGKGSDQAAKKLKELHSVLGHVDDKTVENFKNAGKLAGAWEKATAPSRAVAFEVIGDAIGLASNNLDFFAGHTNKTFEVAGKSIRRWFRGLDSGEGRAVVGRMFNNFNRALGPLLDGLGNIGVYLGRLGAEASRYIPGIARTFERWSKGVADGASNTEQLRGKVERAVTSLKKFGNFLLSAGRLLRTVFGGGVESGQNLLDDMSSAMDRWNRTLQTTEGQEKLGTFFERASEGAKALFGLLGPLISGFVQWATALSPIVTGFLRGAGAIADFVTALLSVTALRGPLTALAFTLGALWGVSKIRAATTAVIGFTRALGGLRTAQVAVAATSGAAAAGGGAAALAGGAGAAGAWRGSRFIDDAGKAAAKNAGKMAAFRSAAAGASAALLGISLPAAAVVAGVGLVGYAFYKSATRVDDYEQAVNRANDSAKAFAAANAALPSVQRDLAGAYLERSRTLDDVASLERRVGTLSKHNKTNTDAYRESVRQLKEAHLSDYYTQQRLLDIQEKERATRERSAVAAVNEQQAAHDALAETRERWEAVVKSVGSEAAARKQFPEAYAAMADAATRLEKANYRVRRSHELVALGLLNQKRAMAGLAPIAQRYAGYFARLQKSLGTKGTQQIALKFIGQEDAGRVAKRASQLLDRGISKERVLKIIADSDDAEEALRRLNRIKIRDKKLRADADTRLALAKLLALGGIKIKPKTFDVIASTLDALKRLGVVRIFKIATKTFSVIAQAAPALGPLSKVKTLIDTIRDKTVTIRTNHVSNYTKGKGRGDATGAAVPTYRHDWGAWEDEISAAAVPTSGGRYARPTFLVGEERRPEVVISSRPDVRSQNIDYWMRAARMLGIPGFADGGFPYQYDAGADIGGLGAAPSPITKPTIGKRVKPKKRRAIKTAWKDTKIVAIKSGDTAANFIKRLQIRQEDTKREISIAEGQIQEPEFLVQMEEITKAGDPRGEVGERVPVEGPDGKAKPDWSVINPFRAQLERVRDLFAHLRELLKAEVENIPTAMASLKNKRFAAEDNLGELRKERRQLEDDLRDWQRKSVKPKDKRGKKRKQDNIDRLKRKLKINAKSIRTNETRYEEAGNDFDQIKDRSKEAGFEYREAGTSLGDYQRRIAEVGFEGAPGRRVTDAVITATKEIKSLKESSGGGGGGDEGAGLSPDDQARLDQANRLIAGSALAGFIDSATLGTLSGAGGLGLLGVGGGGVGSFAAGAGAAGATVALRSLTSGAASQTVTDGAAAAAGLRVQTGGAPGSGPGGVSTFDTRSDGGGATVNIYTLHPGDPKVLDAVGRAAVGGFSLQGAVVSPRQPTGL
jgi:hypothetical protein